jgi:hypothetical protein
MRMLLMLIVLMPMVALGAEEAGSFDWLAALMPGGLIAVGITLVIEFIIGKTDWIKANSIGEVILNMVLKLVKKETSV